MMPLTSIYFILIVLVVSLVYYLAPHKLQQGFLLLVGLILYGYYAGVLAECIVVAEVLFSYICARLMDKPKKGAKYRKRVFWTYFSIILCVLIIFCYKGFFVENIGLVLHIFSGEINLLKLTWAAPLGISFFSFSLLSYVINVYWGIESAEKNVVRFLLFGTYFPVMTTGPILNYSLFRAQVEKRHLFNYENIILGIQRIVWGSFKCLVIARRIAPLVSNVYAHYDTFSSIDIILATIVAAFELYLDFSGSVDIVLGISQIFGIELPENFNRPFFAESSTEFWRRWHISLSNWLKTYVFYPLMKSDRIQLLNRKLCSKCGKKTAKILITYLVMFVLWTVTGIWHGGQWKYLIGVGWLYWFYIMEEELIRPKFERFLSRKGLRCDSLPFRCIRRLITRIKFLTVVVFFFAQSFTHGVQIYKRIFTNIFSAIQSFQVSQLWNLGIQRNDCLIALFAILIFLLGCFMERKGDIRIQLSKKPIMVRWLVYYMILFILLIYGCYGEAYDTTGFIYQQF